VAAAAIVVGLATIALRTFAPPTTWRPSVIEFALAGLNMVSSASFLGLCWLALYGVGYWGCRTLVEIFHIQADARTYGLVFSTPFIFVMALGLTWEAIQSGAGQLYPERAGLPSRYYTLAAQGRRRIVISAVFVVLILGLTMALFRLAGNNAVVDILCLMYLFGVASAVRPRRASEPQQAGRPLVERIASELEENGFVTILSPRTGLPDLDPLLADLDLFAYRGEDGLAVEVKTQTGRDGSVDWKAVTGLVNAARVLRDATSELPNGVVRVTPMLILVDSEPDPSLLKFCSRESVPVVSVRLAYLGDDMRRGLSSIATAAQHEVHTEAEAGP
jgi:hypothetical protein